MTKPRYAPRCLPVVSEVPFTSVEEAWFWYMRCERVRREGARMTRDNIRQHRPCEPDDLNRWVMALYRAGTIGPQHLKVLAHFGWQDRAPDPRVRGEVRAHALWDEALDRLATPLKSRGIVEVSQP